MDTQQVTLIIVALAAVGLVILLVWLGSNAARRRRADLLRDRFGPEYDEARHQYGPKAEKELEKRVERVHRLHLRPLSAEARTSFESAWRDTQARFVDDPSLAVAEADRLIKDVMEMRGYPMADFERRAADISVEHPAVVSDYRAAHEIAVKGREGRASVDELRRAMVHYKALFQDLLAAAPEMAETRR